MLLKGQQAYCFIKTCLCCLWPVFFVCLLQLIFSLVMNIISACLSTLGILILSIASLTYHPEANAYNWSHVSTKFNNNWIKNLDINGKTMVNDVRCNGKVWKRQPNLMYLASNPILPWEYLKIRFSPTKETLEASERDQNYHYEKIKW